MPQQQCPPCPKCGCRPQGYLELFETVNCARCQHCQKEINVREMAHMLGSYSDAEIVAEGEKTGRLLCDDEDSDHDFGE